MYALVEKGNTYFFRRKLRSNSFATMALAVVVNEVLCAAFFQESASSPFQRECNLFFGFFVFHASIAGDEADSALDGILGIPPGLVLVSVIELFDEMTDVRAKLIEIPIDHLCDLLLEIGHFFLVHMELCGVYELSVMRQTEIRLLGGLLAELLLCFVQIHRVFDHLSKGMLDAVADVAGAFQLFKIFGYSRGLSAEKTAHLAFFSRLSQVAFKYKSKSETVIALEHYIEMSSAKAETVGLYSYVRLHH